MLPDKEHSLQCLIASTRNHHGPYAQNSSQAILSTSPSVKLKSNNHDESSDTTANTNAATSSSSSPSSSLLIPKARRILTNNHMSPIIEMTDPDNESTFILSKDQSETFASLLAGLGSGTLSSIACAPLDLIRTRMQVVGDFKSSSSSSKSKMINTNIVQGLKDIIATDGIRGCFRGLCPTLMTVPTFWGLYFPSYEFLKKDLYRRGSGSDFFGTFSLGSAH